MISLCSGWEFAPEWIAGYENGAGSGVRVRLPHNAGDVPLHYAQPSDYEKICGYRRALKVSSEYAGKRLFLQFDGAAHFAEIFVNGVKAAEHRSAYTAFRAEITDLVHEGENLVTVRLDSRESLDQPPFGYVIDYLTYSGLYREVWLDVRPQNYIEDVYVTTPDLHTASVEVTLSASGRVRLSVLDGEELLASEECMGKAEIAVPSAEAWSPDSPRLYTLRAELIGDGDVSDSVDVSFGFRTVEFRADGLYLNGVRTFMRGLNRHQCWPYVGYAAPESLQREDARILKRELTVNTVRTSHYPQSQYFIDECDRQGLLVFTEIPGWQHIGGDDWKKQTCENVREMVLQYRNHPSIVLWGVRINESVDCDELYALTNTIARELDPSRPTSGVRYLENSSLLEDVYSYNDFSHKGDNPGVKPKSKVMKDRSKALLITENNGHMFPTKPFDPWQKRQEHALRHARVQNDALADGDHAGCIDWCMFDYATHKDFGSGDRICYHGVMDAFRNPKLAAALFASQSDELPVLEVGSSMDIGDYPGGDMGDVYIFTNADEVDLYKNDAYVTSFSGSAAYPALPHGPMLLSDTVGKLLETQEGFDPAKASMIRDCLLAAGKYGVANLPLGCKLKFARCMLRYGLKYDEAVRLYGKYIGNWGGEATVWRFEGKKNGEVVSTAIRSPSAELHLDLTVSSSCLREGDTYDMAAVRIRVLDAYGNVAPFAFLPLRLALSGDAELVGPDIVTAEGGMTGTYVRSVGRSGRALLTVSNPQTGSASVEFAVYADKCES